MYLKTWLQTKSYHTGNSIRIVKGYNGQLGISQHSTLVMHRAKLARLIRRLKSDSRGVFPGQNIDILKYSEQNTILQYTASHKDNVDYAGFATHFIRIMLKI